MNRPLQRIDRSILESHLKSSSLWKGSRSIFRHEVVFDLKWGSPAQISEHTEHFSAPEPRITLGALVSLALPTLAPAGQPLANANFRQDFPKPHRCPIIYFMPRYVVGTRAQEYLEKVLSLEYFLNFWMFSDFSSWLR